MSYVLDSALYFGVVGGVVGDPMDVAARCGAMGGRCPWCMWYSAPGESGHRSSSARLRAGPSEPAPPAVPRTAFRVAAVRGVFDRDSAETLSTECVLKGDVARRAGEGDGDLDLGREKLLTVVVVGVVVPGRGDRARDLRVDSSDDELVVLGYATKAPGRGDEWRVTLGP